MPTINTPRRGRRGEQEIFRQAFLSPRTAAVVKRQSADFFRRSVVEIERRWGKAVNPPGCAEQAMPPAAEYP
jgi:hypothetical protein